MSEPDAAERSPVQPATFGIDEPALLERLRAGEDGAFAELFQRHAVAVRRLALGLAADRNEAEDITAETFFRVLRALRRGAGPTDSVRAYLLTVARRVCGEWRSARRDVPVSDDELSYRAAHGADTNARSAEHTLITTAFTSLPERWRMVLWQTEVVGEQPAVVAPHFGLSPNATAALARRARLGLRAAYLQAHLASERNATGCRTVLEKLGGYTAGSVTGVQARRIRAHLRRCPSCRSTHDELTEVCSALRAHSGAVALLLPASAVALGAPSSSGLGTASSVGLGAVGTGAPAAVSGPSSVAAAAKGLVIGSKIKVGLAVASTTAAGVFGVTGGAALLGVQPSQPIGLPGSGQVGLTIERSRSATSPTPSTPPSPPERTSTRANTSQLPSQTGGPSAMGADRAPHVSGSPGSEFPAANGRIAAPYLPSAGERHGSPRRERPHVEPSEPGPAEPTSGPTSPLDTTAPTSTSTDVPTSSSTRISTSTPSTQPSSTSPTTSGSGTLSPSRGIEPSG